MQCNPCVIHQHVCGNRQIKDIVDSPSYSSFKTVDGVLSVNKSVLCVIENSISYINCGQVILDYSVANGIYSDY